MLDAFFIETDRREYGKPRDDYVKTRRSGNSASATKYNEHHFRYKAKTLVNEPMIVEKLSVTPANVLDSRIDLSIRNNMLPR